MNIRQSERSRIISKTHRIVSLFSGCGGMDLGFMGGFKFLNKIYKRLPFEIVFSNDISSEACDTYSHNLNHLPVCGDISKVMRQSEFHLPPADVVIGGFPCQDFSIAGKRQGFNAKRGQLYRYLVKAVKQVQPRLFIAENVKGLVSIPGALETIKRDFSDIGYNVQHQIINAQDYGVPQSRERVIIVGVAEGISFSYPKKNLKKVSSKEALQDLESVEKNAVNAHNWSGAKRTTGQGQKPIKADDPSSTIRAEHHGNIEFHYSLNRRLSVREAARLQSFPDKFLFSGTTTNTYKQVGNAVPPVMAWHIAKSVLKAIQ